MTGIDAVSMNLKLSMQFHYYKLFAILLISVIIANLSWIFNPVIAMSMSLDSNARPVVNEPNITTLGDYVGNTC
jgi:hypothetical protein